MAARPGCWSPPPLPLEERQMVHGIQLLDQDEPGFWESLGYHNYGDPWREQRYWGD
jgi:DMSO/TMAO reductase YedYZ molybdopterin-dependent catalytic subunit